MSTERLKRAFSSYRRVDDVEAEKLLLGRTVEPGAAEETAEHGANPAEPVAVPPNPESAPARQPPSISAQQPVGSIQVAPIYPLPPGFEAASTLVPRPIVGTPEPTSQVSFRLPLSLATRFRRTAKYNRLEQQDVVRAALEMILSTLPKPPDGWQG